MRSDKKIVLHYLAGILAASALSLSVSSCSSPGVARPDAALSAEAPAPVFNDPVLPGLRLGGPGVPVESMERLERLRREMPGTAQAARASFLLGVLAVEKGAPGALVYIDDASSLAAIPDYLAFYRARAYAVENDHEKAALAFDALLKDHPGSALVAEASYFKSLSLLKDGRFAEARDGFESFVRAHPGSRLAPGALLKSAEASALLGRYEEAAKAARRLLIDFPASPAAAEAMTLYRQMTGRGQPDFTPSEGYRRAGRLLDDARFKEALAEFSGLAAGTGGEYYDRAVIGSIVSKVRLKDYAGAGKTVSAYLNAERTPPEAHELDALYWAALVSLRQGSESGLNDAVRRLAEKYPSSAGRAEALLMLARHYEGRDMAPEAIAAYEKVIDSFRGTAFAGEASWATGWLHYRAGRYGEAFRAFSAPPPSGRATPARSLYWAGRSAERMGEFREAAARYGRLCASYGADYYCRMAEKRLVSLGPGFSGAHDADKAAPAPSGPPPEDGSYRGGVFVDPRYAAAKELLALGLRERAAAEITLLLKAHSGEPGALVELARLFYQAEDFYSAFRVYNSRLSGLSSDGAAFDLSTLSFPPRLVELARLKSPPGSVDPYLIAAVIREESAFNPDAVSATGALGLMQIMPSTGRFIAGRLGEDLVDARELLDPDINIKLGSWYLGYLARRFDGDIVLTIASYNAGPNAVQRWVKTLPAELDEFIESIPYPETRNYAKKVLKSYGEFLRAGGADPAGFLSRPLLVLDGEQRPAPEAEAEAVPEDESS